MKTKPVQNEGGAVVELEPHKTRHASSRKGRTPSVLSAFKLKEILVPVDFSECSEKALAYAIPFAKQFGATITLLHVVEPALVPVPAPEMGVVLDLETRDDTKKELAELRARLSHQVRCIALIKNGRADYEIINVAKQLGSDLIILSTHGRTGFDRLLMGSTVEKVVRRAGCPIFIVRPHEHDFIAGNATDWQAA